MNSADVFGERPVPETPSAGKRQNIVWALTRIDARPARDAVHRALFDTDESVKQAALHSVTLWRDEANSIHLAEFLWASQPPQLRRLGAEAIGRVRATNLASLLLQAFAKWQAA